MYSTGASMCTSSMLLHRAPNCIWDTLSVSPCSSFFLLSIKACFDTSFPDKREAILRSASFGFIMKCGQFEGCKNGPTARL